jgi:RNA polymerase sigma-70 factor (ECF subfamily)
VATTPGSISEHAPEALVVALACTGDRRAFAELVRRRQAWIRGLMRRLSSDATLADDLAQQVFLQAWRDIGSLRHPARFGGWLKRLAINVWRQHARKNDPLYHADELDTHSQAADPATALKMDLQSALATLAVPVRLCVVLSYHEGMSHAEIAELTELPAGTVKSHIRRGAQRLQTLLADYQQPPAGDLP